LIVFTSLILSVFFPPTPRGTWGNFGETRGGVGKEDPVELDSSPTL